MNQKNDEKKECPCCEGKGSFFLEGNIYQNGGIVPCHICNQKGWLNEVEQAEIEKVRKEFNEIVKGDVLNTGIFAKRLKGN